MASNYYFGWKSFSEDEDRPEKPRRFGVTEIRGPDHCLAGHSTTQDVAWIRFERCLEAGADMIMIDADDVCKYADSLRSDVIAKIIGRLGLEKTMFEASS
ncbi:hypothetical protein BHM03_00005572, partial [Ensete ventricosum]